MKCVYIIFVIRWIDIVKMVQEKQAQKYSNSHSGGANGGGGGGGGSSSARSCKKLKQKKIPQRGLGVAKLERLRLEELQKKNGLSLQPSAVMSLNDLRLLYPMPRQPDLILNGDASRLDSSSVSLSNNAANWGKHHDYHSFVVHPNGNLPYETKTPVWLFPGVVHRSEHPCPSSMVSQVDFPNS